MKVAVVSIGSFDTQYSDYHIMRDIVLGLLERGHEVNLIQKQYLVTFLAAASSLTVISLYP